MHANIVVDLGFGDAGKGLITDFLVRQKKAGLVVRYNGGAQAGHHVVAPDGREHTFSQFGSGTFVSGVKTYLSKYVVIHPTALLVEGDALVKKGMEDVFSRLRVSEGSLLITPFHQAANRIHEMMRGSQKHGSCGVGVGEAVEDSFSYPDESIRAGDLQNSSILHDKLNSIRERKRRLLLDLYSEELINKTTSLEWEFFERKDLADRWISAVSRINDLGMVTSDDVLQTWLNQTDNVVFEGAQGVLLDAEIGFHPYTSWTQATTTNALDILSQYAPDAAVSTIGVMRCYAVRHGPGPLPTQTYTFDSIVSEHNAPNQWQGGVRYGWFDAVLSRYALQESGGVDALAVTYLDVLPGIKEWKYCTGYQNAALTSQKSLSLLQRAEIAKTLQQVEPFYETTMAEEKSVIRKIEELTGVHVGLSSSGPSSEYVKVI